MKLFHLADLHIGKKFNQMDLMEDQRFVLEQVLAHVDVEKPDVVLLAGDIYDRRNPSVEAVSLCDWFLSELILKRHCQVIGIGGNHDGGERLDFANGILSQMGLFLQGSFSYPIPEVVLKDEWGEVVFHLFAFADLATLHHHCPQLSGLDYADSMEKLLAEIEVDDGRRHVLLAHGMVLSTDALSFSESERDLSVGGIMAWHSESLEKFDYVALGHLHQAQRCGKDFIRYSGSLLKYSFSEEHHQKQILAIDLAEEASVRSLPLKFLHEVVTLEGELEELLEREVGDGVEDYIRVILTDKGQTIEPMMRLKKKFPRILQLTRKYDYELEDQAEEIIFADETIDDPVELFKYFAEMTQDVVLDEDQEKWFLDKLNQAREALA